MNQRVLQLFQRMKILDIIYIIKSNANKIFKRLYSIQVRVSANILVIRTLESLLFEAIFSIYYSFAEGKKVKGMVRNDVFGGWDR